MSLCLTEKTPLVCSSGAPGPDAEQPEDAPIKTKSMELSALTLNLRALNLLDGASLQGLVATNQQHQRYEDDGGGGVVPFQPEKATAGAGDDGGLPVVSLDEVAWHDTIDDCWLVICDYVYDCTDFVRNHPGGHDVLLEYAGRDASLAFIGTGHSKAANRLLEKFLIGELPAHERIFRTPNGIKIGDCV